MGKKEVKKANVEKFHKTINGRRKYVWMYVGMLISFLASLGVSILILFANKLPGAVYFYVILFILLVIVVLGGELIGVYFGALEQYIYDKEEKKVLRNND